MAALCIQIPILNYAYLFRTSLDSELLIGLKRGVDDLGSKIDAFAEERRLLSDSIALTSHHSAPEPVRCLMLIIPIVDLSSLGSQNTEYLQQQLHRVERECERCLFLYDCTITIINAEYICPG